jgi:hypothetical protein
LPRYFRNPLAHVRRVRLGLIVTRQRTDYSGHYGIRELCDICPAAQVGRCRSAFRRPSPVIAAKMASELGGSLVEVNERAVVVSGLGEPPRYLMQHTLGYQVHVMTKPHHRGRHGRADIGWTAAETSEVTT